MTVQLNHTIVWSSDPAKAARFLAELLDLKAPRQFGHFQVVEIDNGISLDFAHSDEPIQSQHYAFLIGEDEFDAALHRIRELDLEFWADPMRQRSGEINHGDGGRGIYFPSPDGHFLELITKRYGAGAG